jgi:hypothetical protein
MDTMMQIIENSYHYHLISHLLFYHSIGGLENVISEFIS